MAIGRDASAAPLVGAGGSAIAAFLVALYAFDLGFAVFFSHLAHFFPF
jgi:hypothetical protein